MLNWSFIESILTEINFPDSIIHLIMCVVTSVWTNWNGSRNEFFRPGKGIRQDAPMSSYLFVLCMDKLSHMICEKVDAGLWQGIQAGPMVQLYPTLCLPMICCCLVML